MSNILAIDTTLGGCSVALSNGPMRQISERNQQTSQLAIMAEEVMAEANLSFNQLDAYAVTTGPGSFTGVRIGLAFVRGLALATAKPIHAISTLELLAYQAIEAGARADQPILSAINAYRGQLYIQYFENKNGMPHPSYEPHAIELEDIPTGNFTLAGDSESFFVDQQALVTLPDARALAQYATKRAMPTNNSKPAPLYLRAPDAKAQKGDLTVAQ